MSIRRATRSAMATAGMLFMLGTFSASGRPVTFPENNQGGNTILEAIGSGASAVGKGALCLFTGAIFAGGCGETISAPAKSEPEKALSEHCQWRLKHAAYLKGSTRTTFESMTRDICR
jgi:hypothetical protein